MLPALSHLAQLPSAATLANPNSFALPEHQTHTDLSLPLLWARDRSSSGAVMVDIHSPNCSDTEAVSRLANKRHQGRHVMFQLFI